MLGLQKDFPVDERRAAVLENIRNIGLFMIAAQAVIHFAPSGQYDKYIKLISSVIVLFLFMRPFVSGWSNLEGEWRTGLEQIVEEFEKEDSWQAEGLNADGLVLGQLEEEIKSRLNENIFGEAYRVESVSLLFEREGSTGMGEEYDPQFQKVEIVMAKADGEGIRSVLVEEIEIGAGKTKEEKAEEATREALQYRDIFAAVLGIESDRVEVTCIGGW